MIGLSYAALAEDRSNTTTAAGKAAKERKVVQERKRKKQRQDKCQKISSPLLLGISGLGVTGPVGNCRESGHSEVHQLRLQQNHPRT